MRRWLGQSDGGADPMPAGVVYPRARLASKCADMTRTRTGAIVVACVVSACGRVDYQIVDERGGGVVDAGDAAVDAESDAGRPVRYEIETAPHQVGDDVPAEGMTYEDTVALDVACTEAILELDFGEPGPNLESPPILMLNGVDAGSVVPFFPPIDTADPSWQTNPCGSHDYNGGIHVALDVTPLVAVGPNTFLISNGRSDDDFVFQNVSILCTPST